MKNLVRRIINQPVICDTYTCNNMAQFEIGHEIVRAASIQLCEECLKTIIKEGSELLSSEAKASDEPLPFEEVDAADATEHDATEQTVETEKSQEEEKSAEEISESGKTDESIIGTEDQKPVKVYTCKHCGAEYNDLKAYRGHVLNCSKKAKE